MTDILSAKKRIDKTYSELMRASDIWLNISGEAPFIENRGFSELGMIKHGFSTRLGGVSEGIYESMNLGLRLDDDHDNVIENYRRLLSSMGLDHTRISCPDQVHKDHILVADEKDAGNGIVTPLTHSEIDAQITNVRGLPLIVYTADCVPILFVDPVKGVVGTAHAGWRGTVAGIAAKTVQKMQEVFGCDPADIRVLIGPSAGPQQYEVDKNVADAILDSAYIGREGVKLDNIGGMEIAVKKSTGGEGCGLFEVLGDTGKYKAYLWSINRLILLNAGINTSHIYVTGLCTIENHDIFFSHRYTGGRRGLNAGIIALT